MFSLKGLPEFEQTSARNESVQGLLCPLIYISVRYSVPFKEQSVLLILIRYFHVLKMIYDVAMWRNAV